MRDAVACERYVGAAKQPLRKLVQGCWQRLADILTTVSAHFLFNMNRTGLASVWSSSWIEKVTALSFLVTMLSFAT